MTEAGEKWAKEKLFSFMGIQVSVDPSEFKKVNAVLGAFCAEVRTKAVELADGDEADLYLGDAYLLVARELLG
jgi:hypothetical protein